MTPEPLAPYNLDELLLAYQEADISPADLERLQNILRQSPEARSRFARLQIIESILWSEHSAGLDTQAMSDSSEPASSPLTNLSCPASALPRPAGIHKRGLAVAAILVLAAGIGLWIHHRQQSIEGPETAIAQGESTTDTVAVLTRTADAVWNNPTESHAAGEPLKPGCLRLRSGLAAVQFFNGANIILEGPAEFQILSADRAFCSSGRLTAEVPPQARGFRIQTPQMAVVDLGTAFGMEVKPNAAEVHVFKGEVELYPPATARTGLREGQAAAVDSAGSLRFFNAEASSFVSPSGLERRSAESQKRQYDSWKSRQARWNADPSLLVRFNFESMTGGEHTLRNVSASPNAIGNAAIVGCGPAEGRWAGKGALEFRNLSDRIRLNVPGELASVTLAAWVRVDSLERAYNSLFMCEGYEAGKLHWQITHKGVIKLGVQRFKDSGGWDYASPVIFTPERSGRWVHLAVVYDSDKGRVTHFVDGQAVSREALHFSSPIRINSADVGNWSVGTRSTIYPVRNFSGRFDEFALYSRPLEDREILELYQAGTPRTTSPPSAGQ